MIPGWPHPWGTPLPRPCAEVLGGLSAAAPVGALASNLEALKASSTAAGQDLLGGGVRLPVRVLRCRCRRPCGLPSGGHRSGSSGVWTGDC